MVLDNQMNVNTFLNDSIVLAPVSSLIFVASFNARKKKDRPAGEKGALV
jgi:hypothetical protein